MPWVATLLTAGMAIVFLLIGDPGLADRGGQLDLPDRHLPAQRRGVAAASRRTRRCERPYRAPRGTIVLGLLAAGVWGVSTILGFQQFGLPTVLVGHRPRLLGLGALRLAQVWSDRRQAGLPGIADSLHLKLTGAMLLVLVLDGAGYLLAVDSRATRTGPRWSPRWRTSSSRSRC